jgi:hypothetical protein
MTMVGHFSSMAKVSLLHRHGSIQVSANLLVVKCDLFGHNPMLTGSPYTPRSHISFAHFQEFVSALEGTPVKVTNNNFKALSQLCEEFGFRDFAAQLSAFQNSDDFKKEATMKDSEARMRLLALEERMQLREQEILHLRNDLSRILQTQESAAKESNQTRTEVADLRNALREGRELAEKANAVGLTSPKKPEPMEANVSIAPPHSTVPAAPLPSLGNSVIVFGFPAIFEEFGGKQFTLLWRGSRDGFGASEFHGRCDGHANTLTVILETKGNIFGGFTPVEWESQAGSLPTKNDGHYGKADPSMRSFLFTLKNPHNIPARRFALKPGQRRQAIWCRSDRGPHFVDIVVADNCNTNQDSFIQFNTHYTNDTGMDGAIVFTGSKRFQVKEIEVFEITS